MPIIYKNIYWEPLKIQIMVQSPDSGRLTMSVVFLQISTVLRSSRALASQNTDPQDRRMKTQFLEDPSISLYHILNTIRQHLTDPNLGLHVPDPGPMLFGNSNI